MKRIVCLLLALSFSLLVIGCSSNGKDDVTSYDTNVETTSAEETTKNEETTTKEDQTPSVIDNLITQSVKAYDKQAGVDVKITKKYVDNQWILTVSNSGLGDFAKINCTVSDQIITGIDVTLDENVWAYSIKNNNQYLGYALTVIPVIEVINDLENKSYDLESFTQLVTKNVVGDTSTVNIGNSLLFVEMSNDKMNAKCILSLYQ